MALVVSVDINSVRTINQGTAATFRGDINYNFGLIKDHLIAIENAVNELDGLGNDIPALKEDVSNLKEQVQNLKDINIVVQRDQPANGELKAGDFWYRILS